jgi:PhnB protein
MGKNRRSDFEGDEETTMAKVRWQPDRYNTVTPYLCCDGAADAIEYYKKVFGATERMRMPAPDGKIGHAELQIGDATIMLSDEYPEMNVRGPKTIGGSPVMIHVYVEDVDATVKQAAAEGGELLREPEDQFYGDRSGMIVDPFGHVWSVGTHIEDVPPDEMEKRAAKAMAEG